jgi:mannose-1-phosphate guanylyltransferase
VVAFFPSDHYFGDEEAFIAQTQDRILQGGKPAGPGTSAGNPDAPEEAYGWIEPGASVSESASGAVFEVRRPAARLMERGCPPDSAWIARRV